MNSTMRGFLVLASLALLLPAAIRAAPAPRALIQSLSGDVRVQRGGIGAFRPVNNASMRKLYPGDHVQTYQRASAVILIDGSRAALGPRTHIAIPAGKDRKAPERSRIWAVAGRIFLWLIGTRNLEIGTEGAIASAKGTRFIIEVDENGLTRLTVTEGSVDFHNAQGSVVVGAGQHSQASPGVAPTRPMQADPSGYIEWEASLDDLPLDLEFRGSPATLPERLPALIEEARKAREAAPREAAAALRLGWLLNDSGDLTGAEEQFREAAALAPGDINPHICLLAVLLPQHRQADSETAIAAIEELDPQRPEAAAARAALLAMSGADEAVARAADMAVALTRAHGELSYAHTLLGLIRIRQGDGPQALQAMLAAMRANPDDYLPHAYAATIHLAAGDQHSAAASAQRAVEMAPSSALALEALATVEFFAGDLTAARTAAEQVVEIRPDSAGAHVLLSDIAVAAGDLDIGLEEAQTAVALDPGHGPAFSALGMILLAMNDLAHAQSALTRAVELSPSLVSARTGLGVTYARQGRLGQAMEAQKASIALDSSRASAFNNRGAIYLARGELDAALQDFSRAVELQPQWSLPHANLALTYLDMNRFGDALTQGEEAVRLGENSARARTTLARLYLEQNRTDRAWAELRRAVELDENYALAHLQLAEVYLRQGRYRDAVKEQFLGIVSEPAAMVESRDYSRTEVQASAGDGAGEIAAKHDGRGDHGQLTYYASAAHRFEDADRAHSDAESTTALAVVGRQAAPGKTDALYLSVQSEERDKPGRATTTGPEDPNYASNFSGQEIQLLGRRPLGNKGKLMYRIGYRNSELEDENPDSLIPDPKPYPRMEIQYEGPMAEARYDQKLDARSKLVAGFALAAEDRKIAGTLATPNPAPPPARTLAPFSDTAGRDAATFYAEHETQLDPRTVLMLGGRLATREGMSPVLRPKGYLRRDVGRDGKVVLLTRPILRDDVSEISPVDGWALRDWLSPLDLATGGFSQSYELQYQLAPPDGSLLRLSLFHRSLRNFIVDLEDPSLAAGEVGEVLSSGTIQGLGLEWERWLAPRLTGGLWLRLIDSENDGSGGRDIPFQPDLSGVVRLDYIDHTGIRAGLAWAYVGKRYADLTNQACLGSYGRMDMRVAKQFSLHTDAFVVVRNLFDNGDGMWPGYPDQGRRIEGGVQYRY